MWHFGFVSMEGLKSICSTQNSNIGAQKEISRAEFTSSHSIVQFEFV
jgi:hypothetical protein